jgi:hypothetical protein
VLLETNQSDEAFLSKLGLQAISKSIVLVSHGEIVLDCDRETSLAKTNASITCQC